MQSNKQAKHQGLKQHSTSSLLKSLHSTKLDLKLKVSFLTRPPAHSGSLTAACCKFEGEVKRTRTSTKLCGLHSPTLKPTEHGPLCAVAPLLQAGQRPDPLIPNPVLSWVTGRGFGPWALLLLFHCCYL